MKLAPFSHFLFSIAFLLQPVSAFAQTGLCSNPRTMALVKQVYRQSLEKLFSAMGVSSDWTNEMERMVPVEVKSIRTVSIEQAVGRYHCLAALEAKLTSQGASLVNDPGFRVRLAQLPFAEAIQIRGGLISHPVEYAAQFTDDRKQISVEAIGHENLANVVFPVTIKELEARMATAAKPQQKSVPARIASDKKSIDACVDRKVAAFQKEAGRDAVVRMDMLKEWEEQCTSSAK